MVVRHSQTSAHSDRLTPAQAADNLPVTLNTSKAHTSLHIHVNMFNCTIFQYSDVIETFLIAVVDLVKRRLSCSVQKRILLFLLSDILAFVYQVKMLQVCPEKKLLEKE